MKHADPRMPSPDTCVLRDVLERRAREMPDRCFVTFADGACQNHRADQFGHLADAGGTAGLRAFAGAEEGENRFDAAREFRAQQFGLASAIGAHGGDRAALARIADMALRQIVPEVGGARRGRA